ncbi:MAG: c-type cytochrome [Gammaproteobacteria bacterium]|nr:c-type cytochrome [Gammaproteobacteria bacterium]
MKNLAVLAALLLGLTGSAQAGDAEAGKAKAATCAACHNADGNSVNPVWPKLAGQNEGYIVKQLQDLKKGMETQGKEGRLNPTMSPMASPLSQTDMEDLAAYFASQTAQMGAAKKSTLEQGQSLWRGGDKKAGLPACQACHGPTGMGMAAAKFPRLSGQHADYIKAQLIAFKKGERGNDLNAMMRDVASRMSEEQIQAVADYVGGLH